MSGVWTVELRDLVCDLSLKVGFDLCGVSGVADEEGARHTERFESWIEAGYAGEMEYLKRRNESGVLLRSSVRTAIPWAKSVVVCAMNYNVGGPLSIDATDKYLGWIGRYAWSGCASDFEKELSTESGIAHGLQATDYHDDLLAKLQEIETALRARVDCETKCYVDTGPLLERSIAVQAGLGWIGKNTCVLNQKLGSWLLLAVIVTSIPVEGEVGLEHAADRCGSCTRCIDACPTGALIGEREMDASRCIAYLTIEKKGVIAEEFREAMGRQVFGCDICQDVCPWNRRAPIAVGQRRLARAELVNPALDWLGGMDAKDFKRWFKGSPLERTRRKRVLRNVAIAMGNSGEKRFLTQLCEWKAGEDAILAESAEWAIRRIEEPQ